MEQLDEMEAKRYVLRELMDLMDKHEREKLKGSFKPDSEPWKKQVDLQATDIHDDMNGHPNSGSVAKMHEAGEGVTETPPSTGSSSDNDEDDAPVSTDPVVAYSKRRYKK